MLKVAISPFALNDYKRGAVVNAFTSDNKVVKVAMNSEGKCCIVAVVSTCQPYDLIVNYEKPSKNPLRLTEKETQKRLTLKKGETMIIYRSSGAVVINGDTKRVLTREEQIKEGKAREIIIDNEHDTPLEDKSCLITYGDEVELIA